MSKLTHQILLLNDYNVEIKFPTKYNQSVMDMFPNNEYILWDYDSVVDLIKNEFDKEVLDAFMLVRPLALKSDLARYCIQYVNSGWYFDYLMLADGTPPSDYDMQHYDMIVFRDIPGATESSLIVSNSIFFVKDKKNQALHKTIEHCVSNILNKSYGKTSHHITGPFIFGKSISEYEIENEESSILVGDLTFDNESNNAHFVMLDWSTRSQKHFAWHRLPDAESALPSGYEAGSYYTRAFQEKKIYE